MPQNENVTPKQQQMIDHLLQGHDLETTAKQLSVDRKTVYRWLQLPPVELAYKMAKKTLFNETLERLQLVLNSSINTLVEIMEDKESPVASRVKAAQTLMEQAILRYNDQEMNERMSKIEETTGKTHRSH